MISNKIIDYYNDTHIDYQILWNLDKNLAIHFGYYDTKHKSHDKAVINMNRILANIAKITSRDKVLDAGCGVGGSSIWIAKNIGAKVTGLNIHEGQLKIAESFAKKNNIEHLTKFVKGDFTDTNFPIDSFDVIWGIESICQTEDKKDFLKEAKRILKKNGRIIVADWFLQKENPNKNEGKEMRKWLEGWAVPNLVSANNFKKYLEQLNFINIKFKDIKKHIMPSSVRLYRASIFAYPMGKILELLGLRTKIQTGNIISAFYQHKTLKKNLWTYGIFYAEK